MLQVIADQGRVRPDLVGALAHVLLACCSRAARVLLASVNEVAPLAARSDDVALLVARSDDKEAAMRAGADAIDELLRRLFG